MSARAYEAKKFRPLVLKKNLFEYQHQTIIVFWWQGFIDLIRKKFKFIWLKIVI